LGVDFGVELWRLFAVLFSEPFAVLFLLFLVLLFGVTGSLLLPVFIFMLLFFGVLPIASLWAVLLAATHSGHSHCVFGRLAEVIPTQS
jgi:hypothetical protein